MARREKKPVHRVQMTDGKRNIIYQLLQEYDIETADESDNPVTDIATKSSNLVSGLPHIFFIEFSAWNARAD